MWGTSRPPTAYYLLVHGVSSLTPVLVLSLSVWGASLVHTVIFAAKETQRSLALEVFTFVSLSVLDLSDSSHVHCVVCVMCGSIYSFRQ